MLHYEMCSVNIPFHIFYPLCTQPDITFSKLALHKNIIKSALAVKESIMNDIPKLLGLFTVAIFGSFSATFCFTFWLLFQK